MHTYHNRKEMHKNVFARRQLEAYMIKSMTGFGRCEILENNHKFTVELKSVNHRYLDINIKMPKKLGFFESAIRSLLKEYMQRGKVDVFISYEDDTEENFALKYNKEIAAAYLTYLNQMADAFGLENDIRVSTLSRYPEVFTMEEQSVDEKELWTILEKALRGRRTAGCRFNRQIKYHAGLRGFYRRTFSNHYCRVPKTSGGKSLGAICRPADR